MTKILLYSLLLVFGLISSQFLGGFGEEWIQLGTMFCLSFIMIHVGYEFEIDKSKPKQYGWDYLVAATAAMFPWLFCAGYFIWVLDTNSWTEALLLARFSSPTSAGVLFSMLAAAGLSATWVFRKARVLAIFDDLDTILLMIPLKMMMVGMKWQLGLIVVVIMVLLWMAWRYLHSWRLPISWPWIMFYSGLITGLCEVIYLTSKVINDVVPVHLKSFCRLLSLAVCWHVQQGIIRILMIRGQDTRRDRKRLMNSVFPRLWQHALWFSSGCLCRKYRMIRLTGAL